MLFKIHGYDVDFPHQAYGVQLVFMNQVLKTLDTEANALLEAPTGCGKTLSLLCSALAWHQRAKSLAIQRQQEAILGRQQAVTTHTDGKPQNSASVKGASSNSKAAEPQQLGVPQDDGYNPDEFKTPRIYYATRTHSQIAQVMLAHAPACDNRQCSVCLMLFNRCATHLCAGCA
jgi:hypothetical protein